MIDLADLTPRRVIQSLRSRTCPSCGGGKQPNGSLCRDCYWRLPAPMRKALYLRVGGGYERALLHALSTLNAEWFTDPKPVEQERIQPPISPIPQMSN